MVEDNFEVYFERAKEEVGEQCVFVMHIFVLFVCTSRGSPEYIEIEWK